MVVGTAALVVVVGTAVVVLGTAVVGAATHVPADVPPQALRNWPAGHTAHAVHVALPVTKQHEGISGRTWAGDYAPGHQWTGLSRRLSRFSSPSGHRLTVYLTLLFDGPKPEAEPAVPSFRTNRSGHRLTGRSRLLSPRLLFDVAI